MAMMMVIVNLTVVCEIVAMANVKMVRKRRKKLVAKRRTWCGEDGENGAGCDDDDEANDLVDDDVERLLNSPTRGLPAVSVPVPPPFLFLPINAAATATDTVHGNNA